MTKNEEIIRKFVAAWSRLDPSELAEYFAEDGVYHNIPSGPVEGRDKIRKFIAAFTADWTSTNWELINVVADGDLVVTERVDRTKLGKRKADLPCLGIFEMQNGKIKVWRDYFDMLTYMRGAGMRSLAKLGLNQAHLKAGGS